MSKGPETKPTHTKTVEVVLPDDGRETVNVRITVDGEEAYHNDVSTEQGGDLLPQRDRLGGHGDLHLL